MLYACKRVKQEAIAEKELTDKLNNLEQNITINGEENLTVYLNCKSENLLNKRQLGIITQSKAKWVEEGEKYQIFFNLEKRNFNNKYI